MEPNTSTYARLRWSWTCPICMALWDTAVMAPSQCSQSHTFRSQTQIISISCWVVYICQIADPKMCPTDASMWCSRPNNTVYQGAMCVTEPGPGKPVVDIMSRDLGSWGTMTLSARSHGSSLVGCTSVVVQGTDTTQNKLKGYVAIPSTVTD